MSGLLPSLLPEALGQQLQISRSSSSLSYLIPGFQIQPPVCTVYKGNPSTDKSAVCMLQQPCKDLTAMYRETEHFLLLICYQQLKSWPSFCIGEKQSPNAGRYLTEQTLSEKNNQQMNCLFIYNVQTRKLFTCTAIIQTHIPGNKRNRDFTLCPSDPSYWNQLKGVQADGNNQFM